MRHILPAATAASAASAPAAQTQDRLATSLPVVPLAQAIPLQVPVRGKSEDGQGPSTTAVRFGHQPDDFDNNINESLDH